MGRIPVFLCGILSAWSCSCGSGETQPSPAPQQPSLPAPRERGTSSPEPREQGKRPVDATSLGRIAGSVRFEGPAPERKEVRMTSDCSGHGEATRLEDVVVNEGRLANVVVYVKRGWEVWELPAAAPAVGHFTQEGCRYGPHVLAMRTGKLEVSNADATTHNVNWKPKKNDPKNQGQAAKAPPVTGEFLRPELGIPIGCDIHTWMKAWLCVFEHPFFAVSDAQGLFAIDGLPPGSYELGVWHESSKIELATANLRLELAPREEKTFELVFRPK